MSSNQARDPAYALVDAASGRVVVRKAGCDAGPACPNGAGNPVWSPDGRELVYLTNTGVARGSRDLSAAGFVLESSTPAVPWRWVSGGLLATRDRTVLMLGPKSGSLTRTIHTTPQTWLLAAVELATG